MKFGINTAQQKEARIANIRFAKAGGACFYDSEVFNSGFPEKSG